MKTLLVLVSAFCVGSIAMAAGPAVDVPDGATSAAKAYIARLKTGEVKQAVVDFWHADTLFVASFGLTYLDLPDAERSRARAAYADFVAAPFASERLMQLFKTIEVADAQPKVIDSSTVAVVLQLSGDSGRFRTQNTLLLSKIDNGWRIVDQRQGNQPSIRAALAGTYMGEAKGPADSIPVVLERVAKETRAQAMKK